MSFIPWWFQSDVVLAILVVNVIAAAVATGVVLLRGRRRR